MSFLLWPFLYMKIWKSRCVDLQRTKRRQKCIPLISPSDLSVVELLGFPWMGHWWTALRSFHLNVFQKLSWAQVTSVQQTHVIVALTSWDVSPMPHFLLSSLSCPFASEVSLTITVLIVSLAVICPETLPLIRLIKLTRHFPTHWLTSRLSLLSEEHSDNVANVPRIEKL